MSYGQDIVNDAGTLLEGTWEWQGTEYNLQVRNIGYKDMNRVQEYGALSATVEAVGENEEIDEEQLEAIQEQAENLEDFSWETEDTDEDWIASVVDEKLAKPDVDVEETSAPKLAALVEGMMEAWQESTDVKKAKDQLPVDEGN